RGEFWSISGSVFGASAKNRSSLEASLGFAAITGTPRIENGGTFAVDFSDGRRNRDNFRIARVVPSSARASAREASCADFGVGVGALSENRSSLEDAPLPSSFR